MGVKEVVVQMVLVLLAARGEEVLPPSQQDAAEGLLRKDFIPLLLGGFFLVDFLVVSLEGFFFMSKYLCPLTNYTFWESDFTFLRSF